MCHKHRMKNEVSSCRIDGSASGTPRRYVRTIYIVFFSSCKAFLLALRYALARLRSEARFSVGSIAASSATLGGKGTTDDARWSLDEIHLSSCFSPWKRDSGMRRGFASRTRNYYVRMCGLRSSCRVGCILPVARNHLARFAR